MSKTKHTFAKRQREIEKKRKADEKWARRREKNQPPADPEEATDGAESVEEIGVTREL